MDSLQEAAAAGAVPLNGSRDEYILVTNGILDHDSNQNPQESLFFDEVIKFTERLRASARAQSKTLVEHAWEQFGEGQDLGPLREQMLLKIPYADEKQPSHYYNFSQVPSAARTNGRAHVTFFSFNPDSYHGRGHFASVDVFEQLQILKLGSLGDTVDVTPTRSGDMMTFGWAIDGPVQNSTMAFAMTLCALFCVQSDTTPPKHVNLFLKNIRVKTQKHANPMSRMVSSVSGSFSAHRLNRNPNHPCYLSSEFKRMALEKDADVTNFFKMYQQRVAVLAPKKKIESHIESVVKKMLTPSKVSPTAVAALERWHLARDDELLAVAALNVTEFVQKARVIPTLDDGAVGLLVVQSAAGQELALRAVESTPSGPCLNSRGWKTREFTNLCVASACCANFITHFGGALMISQSNLDKMEDDFVKDQGNCRISCTQFMKSVEEESAALTSMPAFTKHVETAFSYVQAVLTRQQRQFDHQVKTDAVMGENEMDIHIMRAKAFTGQLRLDINECLLAAQKNDSAIGNQRLMHDRKRKLHVEDVRTAQEIMRSKIKIVKCSRLSLSDQKEQVGLFHEAHHRFRERVEQIKWQEKIEEHEIAFLHIFDLASLGIAKDSIVAEVATLAQSLQGLVLVEYPVVPSDAFKTVSKVTTLLGTEMVAPVAEPADVADDVDTWSDDDMGVDGDGRLPDIVTEAIERVRADKKEANLAADQFKILQQIAFSTKSNKYAKTVTFTFEGNNGCVLVRHGFLLIPLDTVTERRGTGAEFDITGLAASALQQAGSFANIPIANEYVNISKEFAKKIKRTMDNEDVWECPVPMVRWAGQVANKMTRARNGAGC